MGGQPVTNFSPISCSNLTAANNAFAESGRLYLTLLNFHLLDSPLDLHCWFFHEFYMYKIFWCRDHQLLQKLQFTISRLFFFLFMTTSHSRYLCWRIELLCWSYMRAGTVNEGASVFETLWYIISSHFKNFLLIYMYVTKLTWYCVGRYQSWNILLLRI